MCYSEFFLKMMLSFLVCHWLNINDLRPYPSKSYGRSLRITSQGELVKLCSASRGARTEALSTWPRQLLQHLFCLPCGMGMELWREGAVKENLYRRDFVVRACFF